MREHFRYICYNLRCPRVWSLFIVVMLFPRPAVAGGGRSARLKGAGIRNTSDTSLPFMRHHRDAPRASSMVYFHLACLSARLRMYPLAMKLFLRSAGRKDNPGTAPADFNADPGWRLSPAEDSMLALPEKAALESKVASMSALLETFRDTSNADRYALILLVKQPVFNKRKVFTGIGNVGHSFITLIRFNRDGTNVCRSFGFYPKKSYPLAASPLFPCTPGLFRDDANHDWDEMAGHIISKGQFRAIMHAMESYSGRRYHLSKNNCTDFSLTLAVESVSTVRPHGGHWVAETILPLPVNACSPAK